MKIEQVTEIIKGKVLYPISMEVAGPFAMWARNDAGSESNSYQVPTWSACKGIFESIFYMPSALVIPISVQICKPLRYQSYSFNYRGELRKKSLISRGETCRIGAIVLRDVCYKIEAIVINNDRVFNRKSTNHAHSYQSQFNKRLKRGQSYKIPCLGWSEFMVSFFGPNRDNTSRQEDINFVLPSLLFSCFSEINQGNYSPSFIQNVEIRKGELIYVK